MRQNDSKKIIRDAIEKNVYVSHADAPILNRSTGTKRDSGWLFDFRRVIFRNDVLEATAQLFWKEFQEDVPIQVGGLETAALPIVTAISLAQPNSFRESMRAFFIRKSRKKDGLMRMIEGNLATKDVPVVLVDDILNSGKSFVRQIEVLEELGYTVKAIWIILRFRDKSFYNYFKEKNIELHSLFTLDDFKDSLGTENLKPREKKKPNMPFSAKWKFTGKNPNFSYVIAKSDPLIDDFKVYFGTDGGYFMALNQADGSTAWSYKVGFHVKGKSIFSSPALTSNGLVIFGAYDGNVYALDSKTGKKKWIFFEADYIGSSPAIAKNLGLVFIGLEFGLFKKRGGIAALDIKTGKKKWEYLMTAYTHSSPFYIEEYHQVVIGGNEGIVYLFDAQTGKLQWEFKTGDTTEEETARGFSRFDIKESFTYDKKRDLIVFGNAEGKLFAVNRKTGKKVWMFEAEFGFYSTPLIYKDTVIASSLDKNLYCIHLDTGKEMWSWRAGARIFASPVLIEDKIYIGANTGRMTEINPKTGEELAFITVPERITNKVAYNPKTKRYFLPTFANELYCLERKEENKNDDKK
ncbi:MAG: PQQ-binding-like beta-propeller repeat protein [Candidatus Pacebacteria bacterium]|nr:PQQ-binding-like beta-propeller repeat protein [Candidatus Paceibacterota bacterium]